MLAEPEQQLRWLASGDERLLSSVMAPTPEVGLRQPLLEQALDRRTRTLVHLAALLAVGAPTTSVQWAVERAATAGVGVGALTGALLASAPAAGSARVVECASRMALALGYDVELDRADGF